MVVHTGTVLCVLHAEITIYIYSMYNCLPEDEPSSWKHVEDVIN